MLCLVCDFLNCAFKAELIWTYIYREKNRLNSAQACAEFTSARRKAINSERLNENRGYQPTDFEQIFDLDQFPDQLPKFGELQSDFQNLIYLFHFAVEHSQEVIDDNNDMPQRGLIVTLVDSTHTVGLLQGKLNCCNNNLTY